ncbi:hypothetical protein MNBD_UNCLBAC01-2043 [hydrothermal vent metagenome]|uniref:Methanol oxidation genes, glmU-like n=1 Tax=hydrothermal vent metagenome TaxID=652676 RepID=A0A3B1D7P2_9ZZZZ
MKYLKQLDSNLWIYDGSTVSWYTMPYTTRMTVVRLDDGKIWIHSPEKILDGLINEIRELGEVEYIISPNKIHHLFIQDWAKVFPDAKTYAAPGLKEKRNDVNFYGELEDYSEIEWKDEIDQLIFKGSRVMDEVVFFHKKSRTLILTDLIENFSPNHFTGVKKILAVFTGIVSPNGKMPLDWRLSFFRGKQEARKSLEKMVNWSPVRIIISHGECIDKNAVSFLLKSFSWVR